MEVHVQTSSARLGEDLSTQIATKAIPSVGREACAILSGVEMRLAADQTRTRDGDIVLRIHRTVHTKWEGLSKGPFGSELVYYRKLGLAANITIN